MLRIALILASLIGLAAVSAPANAVDAPRCAPHESWDYTMAMCMPEKDAGSDSVVLSAQFNAFGMLAIAQGPRGVDALAAPNMFMFDLGKSVGESHFLNLELMGTTELWTYPRRGYPELLQIGEERSDGTPYVDAQHPHSSPIMGLTLSDTFPIGPSAALKVFFAPRGESADGPVAFMHRDSARDNPDAPLGHHVGQDVGHISSTVIGAQLSLGRVVIEGSVFNGAEPLPTKVDLPMGPFNSEALRVTWLLAPEHRLMGSLARVEQRDDLYPGVTSASRWSVSLYDRFVASNAATIDNTFLIGSIKRHPTNVALTSLLDEAVVQVRSSDFWGRIETLQRLRSELAIAPLGVGTTDDRRWVSAVTLGYTHWSEAHGSLQFGLGTSVTIDALPGVWAAAYGGRTPVTGRLIIQVRGVGHWKR